MSLYPRLRCAQANTTQGLLETAMPPVVARELLQGTPVEALARSYSCATIAFVALDEYGTKVRLETSSGASQG